MMAYATRRLLWSLPVLWAAATLVWVFMFLIPGDAAQVLSGRRADPAVVAVVRAEWGLDRPVLERYLTFLGKLARLDLGWSYAKRLPVATVVAEALGRTLFLAAAASLLSAAIGLAAGAAAGARPGSALDAATLAFTTASLSLPSFWVGLLLMMALASTGGLGWLPLQGFGDGGSLLGLKLPGPLHLILPSLTLALVTSGALARVFRASLLEEGARPYARAARARGRAADAALLGHVAPNAMLSAATVVGLTFGDLLGGAVATETIFNWPGLGKTLLDALHDRDLPVVEGCVLALTAAFLAVNLAVDLVYGLLDPRIRD